MAKFIIEVDDDFIREQADPELAKLKMNPEGKGSDAMKAMFDMIAYSAIKRRIDKGETEFRVTREMMTDENKIEYWERNVPDVLMLVTMASLDKEKEDEEHDT